VTEQNPAGRTYRHGTLSAYTAGKCRCVHCRHAFAEYRAKRRLGGLDTPRAPRVRDTDGHVSNQWFRDGIWKPACKAAGIDPPVRLHDLRHSHASWLLAGGASLQVVKERLGHVSIATTDKYLHTLPDADDTALAALDRVRSRGKPKAV
jgi:site-specific recombinase XerD